MKFKDITVNKKLRYSLGVDAETNKYYLSIPVSNRLADYEEFYRVTEQEFLAFSANEVVANEFAEQCRRHLSDDRLIIKPGKDRGTAI